MVFDHVGYVFFPDVALFRLLGRLSMPMFAYSQARSFRHYSKNPGTLPPVGNNVSFWRRYKPLLLHIGRLSAFAAISQFPFYFLSPGKLNIGFTWILAFLAFAAFFLVENNVIKLFAISSVVLCGLFLPVDYGLYGVLYPSVLFACFFRFDNVYIALAGSVLLYLLSIFQYGEYFNIQIFAIFVVPIIDVLKKHDKTVCLNKWFYYVFYPAHIAVILLISRVFI